MKFIILHGTDATPHSNWFNWLKEELTTQGHQVWLPQLPNAHQPNPATYIDYLLGTSCPFELDSQTVLIGHSSGAVAILHLLQKLPSDTSIKAAILVSAFSNDLGWNNLSQLFEIDLNFKRIKQHCPKFIFIHSDTDPYVPLHQAQILTQQTSGQLILIPSQGHFNTEHSPSYTKFPYLMDVIEEL